ncbi:energy transducer TonB [Myxococcota bacterium]|nr:energy transducer TonB [Myxococcota bacterium]
MIATRLLLSAVPAWLVTFALFHLMQSLISVEAKLVSEGSTTHWLSIVKVMLPEKPKPRAGTPIRRVVNTAPPAPLPTLAALPGQSLTEGFTVREIDAGEGTDPSGNDEERLPSLDGDAIPLVRVEPRYPAQAMRQGREGRVLVEFTIGRSGSVEAARVIAAEPEGVFDREALEAVRQWKYNPRIEQGRPVPQPGIRTTITFRIDQARS